MHDTPDRIPPRPKSRIPLDPSLRRRIHGPIHPMDEPGMIEKVLRYLRAI